MEAAEKIAMVNKYVEAFEKASLDSIREIFAEDATVEDPVGTEIRAGIESICEFYQTGFDMGARLTLTGQMRAAGNAIAFPFIVNAAGMKINVIDVFEFNDNGKVKSMKAYWGPENLG